MTAGRLEPRDNQESPEPKECLVSPVTWAMSDPRDRVDFREPQDLAEKLDQLDRVEFQELVDHQELLV